MLTAAHIIGIILTVGLLLAVSILSGRKVKDAKAFTTGGTSGSWMVCGAMMGTLMGGQSTVGTAQLAFSFGISAWWFTIGAALGGVLLAVFYAAPIRRSGCTTLLQIVAREYGRKTETVGSLLFLIGIFISIVAQVLSSSAMIGSLFRLPMLWAAIIAAALVMLLVLLGGIRSAGAGGIVKLILLYTCSMIAGGVVLYLAGGLGGIYSSIESIHSQFSIFNSQLSIEDIHNRYANLLARGPLKDIGGCLSLMLGVVTTQTYAQCIWSGATTRKARRGALLCSFFIPFIGASCTLIGMYMRGHYVTADEFAAMQAAGENLPEGIGILENSAQAFPTFILNHMSPWLGGIVLGALLINILGCASGLSLGAATIVVRDVTENLRRYFSRQARLSVLMETRLSIVAILALAVVSANLFNGAFINDLGFLSLGLRAVALLFPLSFALWMPGWFNARAVLLSMPIGTAAMILGKALALPGDPVYYGLAASLLVILSYRKNRKPSES